jgi:hypothetical protein
MADGCVYIPAAGNGGPVTILTASEKDRCHLEKFNLFLGSNRPIYTLKPSGFGRRPVLQARVASKKLADRLACFGVLPRKSMTAKVEGLEKDRDFWRGVVDGDGTLGLYGTPESPQIRLAGSRALVSQFSSFMRALSTRCKCNIYPQSSIFVTYAVGCDACTVVSMLYKGASVSLDRKVKKVDEIVKWGISHGLLF